MKRYKFFEPMFGTNLHLLIGSEKEYIQFCKKKKWEVSEDKDYNGETRIFDGGMNFVVWLKYQPSTPKGLSVLVHELQHITAIKLREGIDVPLSRDSEEVYCYMIQHFTYEILTKLRKKK